MARGIAQKEELHGGIAELLIGEHAVNDEDADVVPLAFESLAVGAEKLVEARGHFLGNVTRYFLHGRVRLEIASRHVKRDVGRVYHALKQLHEVGHNTFHRVGNIHLVAVQLYAVSVDIEVILDFREVENSRKREGEVYIKVYPEEGVFLAGI